MKTLKKFFNLKKVLGVFGLVFVSVLVVSILMGGGFTPASAEPLCTTEGCMFYKLGGNTDRDRCMEQRFINTPSGWTLGFCPKEESIPTIATTATLAWHPSSTPTRQVVVSTTQAPPVVNSATPGPAASVTATSCPPTTIVVTGTPACDWCSIESTKAAAQSTMAAAQSTMVWIELFKLTPRP